MRELRQREGRQLEQSERVDLVYVTTSAESELKRFEREVHRGLGLDPKLLSSMYFYDDHGSELFRRIMQLPEYYLTRTEMEILERNGRAIVAPVLGADCDIVDLGAGDALKTRILLDHFRAAGADVRYAPVDVSEYALRTALKSCREHLPWLSARGVVAEYAQGIAWLAEHDPARRRFVLALGSNIGNLQAAAARQFFQSLQGALRPGDYVLVGFDLVKDVQLLQRAYDDSAGVTEQFNLGLLRRINRELGGNFDLKAFRHFATYSPKLRAMESYLLSLRKQSVQLAGKCYQFEAWEPIQTEISCKYRPSDVSAFAREAGFAEVQHFFDERRWFLDALWQVPDVDGGGGRAAAAVEGAA